MLLILGTLTAYNFYTFYRVANAPGQHTLPNDHTMIRACVVGIAGEWLMLLYVYRSKLSQRLVCMVRASIIYKDELVAPVNTLHHGMQPAVKLGNITFFVMKRNNYR